MFEGPEKKFQRRIFDNIEQDFFHAFRDTLNVSDRADFCLGYFNLRGWKQFDSYIEKWSGDKDNRCSSC
jgi:hypothetical protein